MQGELFASDNGPALAIPPELAERYHLAPGVSMEITATDDGLILVPLDVKPWFSFEWERALDAVIEEHREALEMAGD